MNNNGEIQPSPDLVDITKQVSSYTEKETTNELYDFGKMLLLENVDRQHWIDSKAGTVAGFSGAIVALLLSTSSSWKRALTPLPVELRFAVFIGIVFILLAGLLAFLAFFSRTFMRIDEKKEWLDKDYFEYPDLLKRFYVLTMYNATASHSKVNDTKMKWLSRAQTTLLIGGGCLAVPLLVIVWGTLWT
jgi:hypothetical protein